MSAPSLHELSAKAQAICLEYYQAGYEHGKAANEAEHWGLPSYSEAVDAIIDLGTWAIDRARRSA